MAIISSKTPQIKDSIEKLCGILRREGSFIDPNIEIKEGNGEIGVFKTPQSLGTLFRLPHDILPPYDAFDLDVKENRIIIVDHDENVTKVQLDIFTAMLDLYNATDKLSNHIKTSPWFVFQEKPEILKMFFASREGEDIDILRRHLQNPDFHDELALLTFFKSRLISCHRNTKQAEAENVLIPIMEFLNHHPLGAGFDNLYHEKQGFMEVMPVTPVKNSNECFTCYGRLDAMDSYLHYGFINTAAKFLRSIPLTIEIVDLGIFNIRSLELQVPEDDIPKSLSGLSFYIPRMAIDTQTKHVELSHLFVPNENARFSLRRILEFVIKTLRPDINENDCLMYIGTLEDSVIKQNIEYYNTLKSCISSAQISPEHKEEVLSLCAFQADFIHYYGRFHN